MREGEARERIEGRVERERECSRRSRHFTLSQQACDIFENLKKKSGSPGALNKTEHESARLTKLKSSRESRGSVFGCLTSDASPQMPSGRVGGRGLDDKHARRSREDNYLMARPRTGSR